MDPVYFMDLFYGFLMSEKTNRFYQFTENVQFRNFSDSKLVFRFMFRYGGSKCP